MNNKEIIIVAFISTAGGGRPTEDLLIVHGLPSLFSLYKESFPPVIVMPTSHAEKINNLKHKLGFETTCICT